MDKNKNIIIKEIQSLKIYCVNKLERADKDTEAEKNYLKDEDKTKLNDIISKLESYIDMIATNLSTQITDVLAMNSTKKGEANHAT